MASAEHRAGDKGAFETELMLSLEPATITDRRYPLLFQTGETAYGRASGGCAASAQFHHGPRVPLRAPACRRHYSRSLLRPRRRSGARPRRFSAPRLGHGTAAGSDLPPLAGFNPHRRRGGHRRHRATRRSSSKPADFMAPNPARIAGSSRPGAIDSWSAPVVVLPDEQLGGAGIRWKTHASRGARARRSDARRRRRSHTHGQWPREAGPPA